MSSRRTKEKVRAVNYVTTVLTEDEINTLIQLMKFNREALNVIANQAIKDQALDKVQIYTDMISASDAFREKFTALADIGEPESSLIN